MAYITLLSSVLSFFLIAISADVQDIMVDEYNIDIQLYPLDNAILVTCYFVFKNLRTTEKISMYTDKMAVLPKVYAFKKDTNVNLDFRTFDENNTTRILTLYLNDEIDPGLYVMNITFMRYFNYGFNQVYSDLIHEKEVVWLSATHFQPIWVQRIIPCWVTPKNDTSWRDMPTFNLSILHFAHYTVLTNMPIRKERLDEKAHLPDMKRTYFDTTPQMSPYQLSIVVTNFTRTIIDEDDVVSMWCRNRSASSLQFALTIAKNITTYLHLSRRWLRSRFSTRVNLIVIPKIQNSSTGNFPERNDSLVHPGIIIANEHDITYNEENDTVGRKYNVIRLLGYKVTQEYYEWIVNSYWEPSTWLSKGFATFFAMHIFNQTLPNLRMIDLFVVQIQHECLDFDVTNDMLPFPDQNGTIPVEIIDNMKASVLLRMLQHLYTSEVFWKAIDTFAYESVVHEKERHLEIFWKALKDAHDKIDAGTFDIEGLMHLLVEGKGYPVLNVKRNYDTPTSTMELLVDFNVQEEIQSIPVSYTTRTNLNFNQTRPHSWSPYNVSTTNVYPFNVLHPPRIDRTLHINKNFTLDLNYTEDSWVILNIQQTGYYRVNYDDENWARISTYLNDDDYWKIHVLNRAQLIDDAFHFMLLGKLKANIFWRHTRYLGRETDYIAWYPMFKAIEYMSTSFHSYDERLPILPKLARMLTMLLSNIKYEKQPTDDDFTKALRQEATRWTCCFNMVGCLQSTFLLEQHLITHKKLLPWWKKWTYCYGLRAANNITWHQTLNKMKGNDNDKFLYLVTCPNHLAKINDYTSTTYTNDNVKLRITPSTIDQFELRHFVYTIVDSVKNDEEYNYENYDKTYKDNKFFKSLLNNFAHIKPRQLKLSTAILILFNSIYSVDPLNDVWQMSSIYKGIPQSHIRKKLVARRNQINNNHLRLFVRIKPGN